MQQLGHVITAVAVDARLAETAARIDELEEPRDGVVKDVGETEVTVDDLATRFGGHFFYPGFDLFLDLRPAGEAFAVQFDMVCAGQPRKITMLGGKRFEPVNGLIPIKIERRFGRDGGGIIFKAGVDLPEGLERGLPIPAFKFLEDPD